MRTMKQIREEMAAAKVAYDAACAGPEAGWRPITTRMQELQSELSAAITAGCVPGPDGVMPHGLRHIRANRDGWAHRYEIGSVSLSKPGDGDKYRVGVTSRYFANAADIDDEATRLEAVAAWNKRMGEAS